MINAKNLDEATARKIPATRIGFVEIWLVMEIAGLPVDSVRR